MPDLTPARTVSESNPPHRLLHDSPLSGSLPRSASGASRKRAPRARQGRRVWWVNLVSALGCSGARRALSLLASCSALLCRMRDAQRYAFRNSADVTSLRAYRWLRTRRRLSADLGWRLASGRSPLQLRRRQALWRRCPRRCRASGRLYPARLRRPPFDLSPG